MKGINFFFLLALVHLSIFVSFDVHAGIYKWVDSNGKTHYGDQPPANYKSKQRLRSTSLVAVTNKEERQLRDKLNTLRARFENDRRAATNPELLQELEVSFQQRLCFLYNQSYSELRQTSSRRKLNQEQQRRIHRQLSWYAAQKRQHCRI